MGPSHVPPLVSSVTPVTHRASCEAKNATTSAIKETVVGRVLKRLFVEKNQNVVQVADVIDVSNSGGEFLYHFPLGVDGQVGRSDNRAPSLSRSPGSAQPTGRCARS